MLYLEYWYLDLIAMISTFVTSFVISYFFTKIFESKNKSKYDLFKYLGIIYGTYLVCRAIPFLYENRAILIFLSYIVSLCILSKDKFSKKIGIVLLIHLFMILIDIPMSMITFNKYGYTFSQVNSMMDQEYFALYDMLYKDANTLSLTGLNNVLLTFFGLLLMMISKKDTRHLYVLLISFIISFLVFSNSIFSYYYLSKTTGAVILVLSQIIAISLLIFIIERLSIHFKYNQSLDEIKFLKEKEKLQYEYYEMVRKNDENVRKISHDIKNNLQVMYKLNDEKERLNIIEDINNDLDKYSLVKYSTQDILNVILNLKVKEAKDNNIDVDVNVKTNLLFMNSIDISNLITNLLDNAIRGSLSSDKKFIKFNIKKKMNYIIIECSNSYNGIIKFNKKNELVSTKNSNHGYGTKIIKSIIDKYNGDLNYEFKDNIFTVIMMIEK